MTSIVPTILVPDVRSFEQFIDVYKNFAKRLQLDICDGQFTPATTISLDVITLPSDWQGIWDFHLMVSRPSRYIPTILKLKPSLVIFHAESDENLLPVFEQLAANNIKTGVAFKKETFPGNYRSYLEAADHALIFAGELGRQGSEADLLQLEKINLIKEIDANIEIGWDGGANLSNARALAKAGIDVINVGNAISGADNPEQAFHDLEAETEKPGVRI
ncbi:hypothetical protein IJI02_01390 [Candidatus Saccharibacteria bacterium]|nr:hypothetical protein [Candidatus Saccharibacteria bacterium]